MARTALVACAIALLCSCSPYGGGEFACTTDSQCGADGKCSGGFCAFPDGDCDSGFRYGELSGPLSNTCVGSQTTDGGVDPDASNCYGSGLVRACFASAPTGAVTFAMQTIFNTDTDTRCQPTTNNVPACVVAAETITVNANLFVAATGMKPLVLVATQTITIDGNLTVASSRNFNFVGAGSDMPGCNAGAVPTGSSGGGGGSFGGIGGVGAAVGGTGGMPGATLTVTALRGGCPGQTGGDSVTPIAPGERGRGGGALYMIAESSITVSSTGSVNASGAAGGGGGTGAGAGGGGAGSGGFLGFDSPMVINAGQVFANGGGGGEASGTQSTGNPGSDALNATTPAAGGTGGSNFGTDGGDGSLGAQLAGQAADANCTGTCTTPTAGGGGGGGAGIIKRYRASSISGGGPISPPAT
jgi:hypothetical protein